MGPKSHKLGGGPRGNLQFDANTLYAVRREDALELISAGLARPHEPGDVELDEAFAIANPPPPPPEPDLPPIEVMYEILEERSRQILQGNLTETTSDNLVHGSVTLSDDGDRAED